MGLYDQLLAKAFSDGDRDLLNDLIKGKAHVKAHFRRDPKTGKLIHIKEHEREIYKTHTVFQAGDKVRVLSGSHAGKILEIKGYSEEKNTLRTKHEDNPNISVSPHLVEHVEKTAANTPGEFEGKEEAPAKIDQEWKDDLSEMEAAGGGPNYPPSYSDESKSPLEETLDDESIEEPPVETAGESPAEPEPEEPADGFAIGQPEEPVKELTPLETIQEHINSFLEANPGFEANKWDKIVAEKGKLYYYLKKNGSDAGSACFDVASGKLVGGKATDQAVLGWVKDLYKFQIESDGQKFGPEQALSMVGIKIDEDPKYGTVLKGNTYPYQKYIGNIVGGKYVGGGITKVQWPNKLADLAVKITPFEKGDFSGQDQITVDFQHSGQPAGSANGGQSDTGGAGAETAHAGGDKGGSGSGGYGTSVHDEAKKKDEWSQHALKKKTIEDLVKLIHETGIEGPPPHVQLSQEVIDSALQPMKHQIEGASAALSAFDKGSAGFLLGDDVGTGKTFSGVAVIAHMKPKRCMVVCPNDIVVQQWLDVLKKAGIEGSIAKGKKEDFSRKNGVILTTYTSMMMNESLHNTARDLVVFDETHFMKNLLETGSKRAENGYNLVKKQMFNGGKVLYMTATPYEKPQQAKIYAALGMWKTTPEEDEFNDWVEQRGVKVHGKFKWKKVYDPENPNAEKYGYKKGYVYKKVWKGDSQSYSLKGNGDAAKKATLIDFIHNIRAGKYLSREVVPEGVKMDNIFTAQDLDPYQDEAYKFVMGVFNQAIAATPSINKKMRIAGQQTMWSRRFCEHAKMPAVIGLAKSELADGRSVSVMTGYKAMGDTATQIGKLMGLMTDAGVIGGHNPMISAGIMQQFTKKLEEMGAQMEGSVKALKDAFPDAVELHGDIPLKQRLANVQKFNSGQAKMIICTQATADTGLSLHDTIGTHPRSQINVTLPWSGMAMKQLSGRSHRLGSKSDTNMHWIFAKVPDEQHRAAIMALKLKILGASAKGIDVDTSDEAYKKMMEFIYKGDIDDPMEKLLKSFFDPLHVIMLDDLIKGRKIPRDYIRTVRGKTEHVVEGNSKKVYTIDRP